MKKHSIVAILMLFGFSNNLFAEQLWGGSFTKLKTRIIRSVAIAPFDQSMIVVGNKGSAAGDAQVFSSVDGGVTWSFLNGGKSLAPNATDVQAVAIVSDSVQLAGTWKHGLYRSEDAGRSFNRVDNFAANDIRSIVQLDTGRLLVATGASGIWKSDDMGASWKATSESTGFFWSIKANSGSVVLATSPTGGVYRSADAGDTWNRIHTAEGLYEAIAIGNRIAAVGDNGMLVSADGGGTWRSEKRFSGVRLSSVIADSNNDGTLLVGSWTDGLWAYSLDNQEATQYAAGTPVLHVRESGSAIVAGSWGKGLSVLPRSSQTPYLVVGARAADNVVVSELLSDGADANSFDNNRNTALIYAGRDGHLDMARTLLRNGADVNWIDGEGVTPLILASFKNHPDMVRLLLENSADKRIVDSFGKTAIDYALARGATDPIAVLLK